MHKEALDPKIEPSFQRYELTMRDLEATLQGAAPAQELAVLFDPGSVQYIPASSPGTPSRHADPLQVHTTANLQAREP
jgi:hypothetical protein